MFPQTKPGKPHTRAVFTNKKGGFSEGKESSWCIFLSLTCRLANCGLRTTTSEWWESSVVGHSVASTPGGNQCWKLKTVDVRGFFYGPICWYHLVPGCGQPQTKPPIGKGLYGVIAFISCEFVWMVYGIMVFGCTTKIFQSSWSGMMGWWDDSCFP